MPTTVLVPTVAPGSYGNDMLELTMAAADIVDQNHFVATGKDLVIAHNTSGGGLTVTITSVANKWGRTRNVAAVNIGAGEYQIFGPMERKGWESSGIILLEASAVDVLFGIVNLP